MVAQSHCDPYAAINPPRTPQLLLSPHFHSLVAPPKSVKWHHCKTKNEPNRLSWLTCTPTAWGCRQETFQIHKEKLSISACCELSNPFYSSRSLWLVSRKYMKNTLGSNKDILILISLSRAASYLLCILRNFYTKNVFETDQE